MGPSAVGGSDCAGAYLILAASTRRLTRPRASRARCWLRIGLPETSGALVFREFREWARRASSAGWDACRHEAHVIAVFVRAGARTVSDARHVAAPVSTIDAVGPGPIGVERFAGRVLGTGEHLGQCRFLHRAQAGAVGRLASSAGGDVVGQRERALASLHDLFVSFELGDKSWKVTASDGRRGASRYNVDAGGRSCCRQKLQAKQGPAAEIDRWMTRPGAIAPAGLRRAGLRRTCCGWPGSRRHRQDCW